MEAIDLKKLKPQAAKLQIGDKTFNIRPINLNDWIWMQKLFGDQINTKLQAMSFHQLCVIIYRLLDHDGKKHFAARDMEEFYDDDGELQKTRRITGPEVMATDMAGIQAMQSIADAFRKAMGIDESTEKQLEAAQKKTAAM